MTFPRVMLPKKRHLISGRLGVTNCGGVHLMNAVYKEPTSTSKEHNQALFQSLSCGCDKIP